MSGSLDVLFWQRKPIRLVICRPESEGTASHCQAHSTHQMVPRIRCPGLAVESTMCPGFGHSQTQVDYEGSWGRGQDTVKVMSSTALLLNGTCHTFKTKPDSGVTPQIIRQHEHNNFCPNRLKEPRLEEGEGWNSWHLFPITWPVPAVQFQRIPT